MKEYDIKVQALNTLKQTKFVLDSQASQSKEFHLRRFIDIKREEVQKEIEQYEIDVINFKPEHEKRLNRQEEIRLQNENRKIEIEQKINSYL